MIDTAEEIPEISDHYSMLDAIKDEINNEIDKSKLEAVVVMHHISKFRCSFFYEEDIIIKRQGKIKKFFPSDIVTFRNDIFLDPYVQRFEEGKLEKGAIHIASELKKLKVVIWNSNYSDIVKEYTDAYAMKHSFEVKYKK